MSRPRFTRFRVGGKASRKTGAIHPPEIGYYVLGIFWCWSEAPPVCLVTYQPCGAQPESELLL